MSNDVSITIEQGATLNKVIYQAKTTMAANVDMSAYTGNFNIKTHGAANNYLTNSIGVSFSNTGAVRISANSIQTSAIPAGRHVYDVIATNDSGNNYSRIVGGSCDVTPGVSTTGSDPVPLSFPEDALGIFYKMPESWRGGYADPVVLRVGDTINVLEVLKIYKLQNNRFTERSLLNATDLDASTYAPLAYDTATGILTATEVGVDGYLWIQTHFYRFDPPPQSPTIENIQTSLDAGDPYWDYYFNSSLYIYFTVIP